MAILFYRDFLRSAYYIADHIGILAVRTKHVERCRCVLARHYYRHADPHVEGVEHVVVAYDSDLLDKLENRQYSYSFACDPCRQTGRYGTRYVLVKAAACNVRYAFDILTSDLVDECQYRLYVNLRRFEQHVSE